MTDIDIGSKLQEYRKQRGMSLRELSAESGVTPSMISQIENNGVNPSINTLRSLADALDFPLYMLFQERTSAEDDLIVRKGHYQKLGMEGIDVQYNLLTQDVRGMIEFVMMDIPAGKQSAAREGAHRGEETAYVVCGDVTIWLDGRPYELHEGDAVKIPPQTPHRWVNKSDDPVKVVFAVTPPTF